MESISTISSNTTGHPLLKQKRLMRLQEVKRQTGIGRSSIYLKIKAGNFPHPIKLGARTVAWLESDIDAWIEQQIAASKTKV